MECRRGLAMRILSVRLSIKHVHCDKTEEKSVKIVIPCERSFIIVFWEKEWLVGLTPSTWSDAAKLTDVRVAGFRQAWYLIRKGDVFIKNDPPVL